MGYANPAQINGGIHLRLFSRAFILDDTQRRVVFASVDCGMMGTLLKMKVSGRRGARLPGGAVKGERGRRAADSR